MSSTTSGQRPQQFTIEHLNECVSQGKIMAAKCRRCGKIHFPPRPVCSECYSKEFDWQEIPLKGRLLTYTIIHIAPVQFQSMTPYAVGIVEMDNGIRIPGMIKVALDQLRIGLSLQIDYEPCVAPPNQWPQWARYFFKPA